MFHFIGNKWLLPAYQLQMSGGTGCRDFACVLERCEALMAAAARPATHRFFLQTLQYMLLLMVLLAVVWFVGCSQRERGVV